MASVSQLPILTGDRYLASLLKFIDANTTPLLDGTLTLKLNPVGLHYVQSRLESLSEINSLVSCAPVDYLRAYVSDLGDHRALEHLRRILGLLTSLKIVSCLEFGVRDRTPISILGFGKLRVLELRGCDLSTVQAKGLLELRGSLEKIICHNSTDAVRHVFASRIVDIKDSPVWSKLTYVSCACNDLVLMDESLQLLPMVETLDLSRNQFAKLANLRKCTKLQHLDIGFNHLRSISSLNEVSCPIVKLVLRNNALKTLRGIENLKLLEGLDLSYNIISSFMELEVLASLPHLQNLWLEGNPLYCARWYRSQVFSFFSHPERLILDDHGITTREYWERHIILASRQKLPAGYGFYFPAKDGGADGESNTNAKKKRYSRLASIEDDDHGKYLYVEAVEQESVSCDSDKHTKDEHCVSDNDSDIISLKNRIEMMKKERSVHWLREFKEWMDQVPSFIIDTNQCSSVDGGKFTREDNRFIGEGSAYTDGENKSTIFESDITFTDTCNNNHGNEHISIDGNDEIVMDIPFKSNGVDKGKDSERANTLRRRLSQLNIDASPHSIMSSASSSAIDEIIGSRASSTDPRSPPHFEDDILQRRLYLEEEFLQLSADSQSLASSDSDTSLSEDDSRSSNPSVIDIYMEHDITYDGMETSQTSFSKHRSISNISATSSCFDGYNNFGIDKVKQKFKRKDISALRYKKSDFCTEERKANGALDVSEYESKGQPSGSYGHIRELCVTAKNSFNLDQDHVFINFFHANLADIGSSETCQQSVHCRCIYQLESSFHEREVYILQSSRNTIYIMVIDDMANEQGATPKLLGCHKIDAVREMIVGLGLQTLRVNMEGDATYIFLPRSREEYEDIYGLFGLGDSTEIISVCSLQSWEQVQLKLLEQYICGRINSGIVFYSLLLFWHDEPEGKSWRLRSLFVIEGYLLVCFEDLLHFGCLVNDTSLPYYSLDSFCSIQNILEMGIELNNGKCLTLTLKNVSSENVGNAYRFKMKSQHMDTKDRVLKWKFKWFSEETLFKFVAVVKAIHLGLTSSTLPVKCLS